MNTNTVQIKAKTAKWFDGTKSPIPKDGTILEVRYFQKDIQQQLKVFFDPKWGSKGCWFRHGSNRTFLYADSVYEWRNTGEKISL